MDKDNVDPCISMRRDLFRALREFDEGVSTYSEINLANNISDTENIEEPPYFTREKKIPDVENIEEPSHSSKKIIPDVKNIGKLHSTCDKKIECNEASLIQIINCTVNIYITK